MASAALPGYVSYLAYLTYLDFCLLAEGKKMPRFRLPKCARPGLLTTYLVLQGGG